MTILDGVADGVAAASAAITTSPDRARPDRIAGRRFARQASRTAQAAFGEDAGQRRCRDHIQRASGARRRGRIRTSCLLGLEGIVSKRLDSPHQSGPSKFGLSRKTLEAVRREREENWGLSPWPGTGDRNLHGWYTADAIALRRLLATFRK